MISLRLIACDRPIRKSLFANRARLTGFLWVWLMPMIIVLVSWVGTSKIR